MSQDRRAQRSLVVVIVALAVGLVVGTIVAGEPLLLVLGLVVLGVGALPLFRR